MHCQTLFSVVRRATPLLLFFACVVSGPGAHGESTSETRTDQLRQLAAETLDARGADAAEEAVVETVLAKFAHQCDAPVPPEREVVTRETCLAKVKDLLQREAEKKVPMPSEEELAAEAAEKYPIHQVGDTVSITFKTNPVRTSKASGEYRGRQGRFLKIGSRPILIDDIRAVPGNDEELLKFFPEQSREKRRKYIARRRADVFAQQDQWKKENRDEMLRMVLRKQIEANEARGYILHEGRWSAPETVLTRMIPELREQARERERKRVADEEANPATTAGGGTTDGDETQLTQGQEPEVGGDGDASKTTEGMPDSATSTADSATEVASSEGETAESADGDGPPADADDSSFDEDEAAPPRGVTPQERDDVYETSRDGIAILPILAVIVGGLIAVAAILCWPAEERGRYYPGGEQGSETFSGLISRFEDVPHVIARFPNRERALSMLAGVSCLSLSNKPGRELSCRLPLEYGFVAEQDGTLLGFVAGAAFEYPQWREARDMLHRSRDVELLSAKAPAPEVHVPREGPVADAVSELGQFEGDEYDSSCYWLFQAESRATAKAFLKQVRVSTAGWHVIVQTPQGHWGRDAQGLYQE